MSMEIQHMSVPRVRSLHVPGVAFLLCCAFSLFLPAAASAQAFGIGGRMAMIRGDAQSDASALRFLGGHLRARLSPKSMVELSLDRRRETSADLSERVTDTPVQASLLLFLARSTFSPYVLGGLGWYNHKVDTLAGDDVTATESSRKMGYHAGFGAEILIGRHAGIGADYRYTFVHFGDDDESGIASHLRPSYKGSMWTAGFTLYF
jgi:opacity protein-like surface antigen